jgi:hypothetical protein
MSKARFLWILLLASMTIVGQGKLLWRDSFSPNKSALTDTGKGTYFILEPGYRLRLVHAKDTLTITVLNDTKVIDGVKTRVVEERETKNGEVIEVSKNYFAVDPATGDAYYFGEDVDIYKNGKIASHEGTWHSGENGARFGLFIPGKPKVGDRFYQELAPKVAMDRAEVLSVTEKLTVPAGTFNDCVHTKESSAIEIGSEGKWYAPEVGIIKDSDFVLVAIDKP